MGYNLPEGNNSFLDNDDMICEHCGHTDDVNNGEYVKDNWYCNNCFKELFHTCKECCEVISVEEDYCDHCLADKSYDESALGMFEKLDFTKVNDQSYPHLVIYKKDLEEICFNTNQNSYTTSVNDWEMGSIETTPEIHLAITQQLKELGWIK